MPSPALERSGQATEALTPWVLWTQRSGDSPQRSAGAIGGSYDRRMQKWEYMVIPLNEAGKLKKKSEPLSPDRLNELGADGWEAVGLSLKQGDLVAWPVVLLKRPKD